MNRLHLHYKYRTYVILKKKKRKEKKIRRIIIIGSLKMLPDNLHFKFLRTQSYIYVTNKCISK